LSAPLSFSEDGGCPEFEDIGAVVLWGRRPSFDFIASP
jgi:hypothetical protein